MDGTMDTHPDEFLLLQVTHGEEQNQWPQMLTYELRSLDDGATHEAPTLAVTTRTMRGNIQAKKDVEKEKKILL